MEHVWSTGQSKVVANDTGRLFWVAVIVAATAAGYCSTQLSGPTSTSGADSVVDCYNSYMCTFSSCFVAVTPQVEVLQPHGNLLAKSGTDFKDLSRIDITLTTQQQQQQPVTAPGVANGAAAAGTAAGSSSSSSSSIQRPTFKTQHIQITSDIPEDPAIAEVSTSKQ